MKAYNPEIESRDLKYYIFDWDDNILRMPTFIHLERLTPEGAWEPFPVSTSAFAVARNDTVKFRPPGGNWENAFREFRDFPGEDESKFLKDARAAMDAVLSGAAKPAPSFEAFKRALVEGRIFAIVTARGHKSETLRAGVRLFIRRMMSPAERDEMMLNLRGYVACYEGIAVNNSIDDDEVFERYLDMNRYHAVTSPEFISFINSVEMPDSDRSEIRKRFAITDFLEYLFAMVRRVGMRKNISVGFSDDDPGNVQAVMEFIRENLAAQFPSVRFVVYDTSDPDISAGRKIVVSGPLGLF
ncbi:MAG: hypothetical protein FWG05_00440 [Kiritimatiellaeota bacterium]|nr:hypothetical protein [Kiritimatiellota bacterium]